MKQKLLFWGHSNNICVIANTNLHVASVWLFTFSINMFSATQNLKVAISFEDFPHQVVLSVSTKSIGESLTLMVRMGRSGLFLSRQLMYPDKEMLRRWSFCHRQPNCWSATSAPMLKVVTAVPAATSQSFTVLSPEAEISWELSGLQLTWRI